MFESNKWNERKKKKYLKGWDFCSQQQMVCQVSVFKLEAILLPKGQLAIFVCHNWEDAAIWMEDKEADTYSTHRTASRNKELSSPSVNSTKVEKQ